MRAEEHKKPLDKLFSKEEHRTTTKLKSAVRAEFNDKGELIYYNEAGKAVGKYVKLP